MTAKKNPLKFTICFNADVPAQAAAADFLNRCESRMKAHYIALGLMLYLEGADTEMVPVMETVRRGGDRSAPPRAPEPERQTDAPRWAETEEGRGEAAGGVFDVAADPDGTLSSLSETDKAAIMESVMLMDDIACGD